MITVRHIIYMVQNDTNPPVDFDIKNDDAVYDDDNCLITPATAYDLTDCTVRFYLKGPDGVVANAAHPLADIIGDPLLGQARYNFITGDTALPGKYLCDVEVTDANNKPQTEYTVTELMVRPENG